MNIRALLIPAVVVTILSLGQFESAAKRSEAAFRTLPEVSSKSSRGLFVSKMEIIGASSFFINSGGRNVVECATFGDDGFPAACSFVNGASLQDLVAATMAMNKYSSDALRDCEREKVGGFPVPPGPRTIRFAQ